MDCTTNFRLPCQDSADPACDAPDVWCDFVSKVESQLLAVDDALARTSTAIPLASVSDETINSTFYVGDPIVFSSVDIDTDSMADLGISATSITPARAGVYLVSANASFGDETLTGIDGQIVSLSIDCPNAVDGVRFTPWVTSTLVEFPIAATSLIPWDPAVNGPIFVTMTSQVVPMAPFSARLSVAWVCDL